MTVVLGMLGVALALIGPVLLRDGGGFPRPAPFAAGVAGFFGIVCFPFDAALAALGTATLVSSSFFVVAAATCAVDAGAVATASDVAGAIAAAPAGAAASCGGLLGALIGTKL